jgi:hypothetical protein
MFDHILFAKNESNFIIHETQLIDYPSRIKYLGTKTNFSRNE